MSAIKNVIIFTVGAATGAATTYIGMKEYFRKKAAEDIAEARDTFRNMRKEVSTTATDDYYESEDQDESACEPDASEVNLYKDVVQKTNYNAMSKESDIPKEPKTLPPYIITEDEYNNIDNYDKQTLDYYEEDGTLTNEQGEIISAEDYIGVENLNSFDESNTLYIRHEHTLTDYEVILYHMSYAQATGDFLEDEDEDG